MIPPNPVIARSVVFIILGIFSCTIIQDSDVETPTELAALRLTSVKVTQATSSGSGAQEFKLLYDSAQNFTDAATNTKITRKVSYSLPAVTATSKLRFRSGSTKASSFYIYYAGTKPYTLGVIEKDSVVELYRFRYSTAGQLNKIITFLNPIDNQDVIWATRDSLVYTQNQVTTLIRALDGAATYSIQYNSHEDTFFVSGINTGGGSGQLFGLGDNGNSCPNGDNESCTNYKCNACSSGSSAQPQVRISSVQTSTLTLRLDITDVRFDNSNNSRQADVFFFHPTMILRGQLQNGNHLLPIYMIDWWLRGTAGTTALNKSEDVAFDFIYAK
jgi:hypothetical protein